MLRGLYEDVRFALRVLGKAKGYTVAAIVTLAIAIGVNTAIFSVVNATLLRPLPYADPDRLVSVWETAPHLDMMSFSYLDLQDLRARQKGFDGLAGIGVNSSALTGFSSPERIENGMVSWDFFRVLGVQPLLGRSFTAEEDRPESPAQVTLLTYGLWKRRFGGDPNVIGRTVTLDGKPYTVIGVLPESFRYEDDPELFTPLAPIFKAMPSRGAHPGITGIARLKPGVSLEQAKQDLLAMTEQLAKEYPDSNHDTRASAVPTQQALVKDVRPILLLLMAAVIFVLLIAIANVANLALARGTARRREMAIRSALGASRGRLVRQLLVESAVVGLGAGLVGVLLALWGVDLLAANRPQEIPSMLPIDVDVPVLVYSFVASLVSGLAFGLLPAMQISRTQLTDALKEGDLRSGAARGNKLRGALVVAEVALAIVLLVGAGLSVRAFARLLDVDPGLRVDHLLTFRYRLPPQKYATPEAITAFHRQLQAKLEALPGVKSVTLSGGIPFHINSQTSFSMNGEPESSSGETNFAAIFNVAPGYFETMGIPLIRGRTFSKEDVASGVRKVIVDEAFAQRFLDPKDPLSTRLTNKEIYRDPNAVRTIEIVGIVKHVAQNHIDRREVTPYEMYELWELAPRDYYAEMVSTMDVSIRTDVDPLSLTDAVRGAVAQLDPDQPIYDLKSMQQRFDAATAARRFAMVLLGLFAALALLIAAMGLYAVIGYMVSQRTREIGIRVALGAQPAQVRRMVVGQGVVLAAIGIAVGVGTALALSRVLARYVFEIDPKDPLTFVVVVGVLAVVALLSSWLPARRAARVDPMTALRYE